MLRAKCLGSNKIKFKAILMYNRSRMYCIDGMKYQVVLYRISIRHLREYACYFFRRIDIVRRSILNGLCFFFFIFSVFFSVLLCVLLLVWFAFDMFLIIVRFFLLFFFQWTGWYVIWLSISLFRITSTIRCFLVYLHFFSHFLCSICFFLFYFSVHLLYKCVCNTI